MIIEFRVSNFRSFHDQQTLSYLASSDHQLEDTHCVRTRFNAIPRLTRTGVVFGPNGSGKSNLLAALRTLRELVLYSTMYSDSQYQAMYSPCAADGNRQSPTSFEIDLLLQGLRYTYTLSYDRSRITGETLRVFRSNKSQRWFDRRYDAPSEADRWASFSAYLPGEREMWRRATMSRALFLTTASQLGADPFKAITHWFEHQLEITLASDAVDLTRVAARLAEPAYKAKVVAILKAVDMPITDFRVSKGRAAPSAPQVSSATFVEFLIARQGHAPLWIESSASGAQRLVTLLSSLLDGIEKDCFVAIDEFDTSLHPLVARFLVQMINHQGFTPRHVQVLLVSHTTSLMDLDLLRRDELWLMELDRDYASRLKSMARCSLRKHEMVARAYLKGRYGAIPQVSAEVFEILAAQSEHSTRASS